MLPLTTSSSREFPLRALAPAPPRTPTLSLSLLCSPASTLVRPFVCLLAQCLYLSFSPGAAFPLAPAHVAPLPQAAPAAFLHPSVPVYAANQIASAQTHIHVEAGPDADVKATGDARVDTVPVRNIGVPINVAPLPLPVAAPVPVAPAPIVLPPQVIQPPPVYERVPVPVPVDVPVPQPYDVPVRVDVPTPVNVPVRVDVPQPVPVPVPVDVPVRVNVDVPVQVPVPTPVDVPQPVDAPFPQPVPQPPQVFNTLLSLHSLTMCSLSGDRATSPRAYSRSRSRPSANHRPSSSYRAGPRPYPRRRACAHKG